jgi:hypothetical protein
MLGKGSTGTGGQFISGSSDGGGTIEISSSNFHLTNAGNVTMAGTVSASAGDIGGWNIEDGGLTQLSASREIGMSTNSGSFYVQDNVTKQYLARFGFFSIDNPGVLSASFFDRFDNGGFETGPGTGWSLTDNGVSEVAVALTTTSGEYHGGNDAVKITMTIGSVLGGGGACFMSYQLISMADGTLKRIVDIIVGDEVLVWNEVTETIVTSPVNDMIIRDHDDVYEVELSSGKVISPTGNHPFFVEGKEWVTIDGHNPNHAGQSGFMEIGDFVYDVSSGTKELIEIVDIRPVDGTYETYNFIDMEYGTIIADGIVTHNSA